jgi:hypothetical protein
VAETKWANSACSPQPDLKDVIADDFQGTSPSGHRYDKAKAIATDTKSVSRDCQLGAKGQRAQSLLSTLRRAAN